MGALTSLFRRNVLLVSAILLGGSLPAQESQGGIRGFWERLRSPRPVPAAGPDSPLSRIGDASELGQTLHDAGHQRSGQLTRTNDLWARNRALWDMSRHRQASEAFGRISGLATLGKYGDAAVTSWNTGRLGPLVSTFVENAVSSAYTAPIPGILAAGAACFPVGTVLALAASGLLYYAGGTVGKGLGEIAGRVTDDLVKKLLNSSEESLADRREIDAATKSFDASVGEQNADNGEALAHTDERWNQSVSELGAEILRSTGEITSLFGRGAGGEWYVNRDCVKADRFGNFEERRFGIAGPFPSRKEAEAFVSKERAEGFDFKLCEYVNSGNGGTEATPSILPLPLARNPTSVPTSETEGSRRESWEIEITKVVGRVRGDVAGPAAADDASFRAWFDPGDKDGFVNLRVEGQYRRMSLDDAKRSKFLADHAQMRDLNHYSWKDKRFLDKAAEETATRTVILSTSRASVQRRCEDWKRDPDVRGVRVRLRKGGSVVDVPELGFQK